MDMLHAQAVQTAIAMHNQAVEDHLRMVHQHNAAMHHHRRPQQHRVASAVPRISNGVAEDFLVRLMRTGLDRDYYLRIEKLGLLNELKETYELCKCATYRSTQISLCKRFMEKSLNAVEAYKRNHR